jgi:phosphoribosylaminoimidazole-succinocarboxamide synthase
MSQAPRLRARGKVRDVYDAGEDRLLLVATDRISAFDVVLPDPVPDKGRVLTGLSSFWFDRLADLVPHHVLSTDRAAFPSPFGDEPALAGRATLVKKAAVVPMECVARGYLSGSGWAQYRETSSVCGVPLPPGLVESARLAEPIFTPTTKAGTGHDLALDPDEAADLVGKGLFERLKELTLGIYERLAETAAANGILVADTKLEFGFADGELIVIDEVGTPDSSRFWPADAYAPGGAQRSFDKQFVRDWLDGSGWDREPPPPSLPRDVVEGTAARYREAYERITGETFASYLDRAGVGPRSGSKAPADDTAPNDDPVLERIREVHG